MEDHKSVRAWEILRSLRGIRPSCQRELHDYVKLFTGVNVPDRNMCEGHSAPLDYLCHAFFEEGGRAGRDAVVWANRGGGKTLLGAAATVLDCVFKPGCQVRILGGSLEQSRRMYEYLVELAAYGYGDMLKGPVRRGRCAFINRSSVEVLTQSVRNVRGRHVHKLRCDELELFDKEVLSAARFVTRSDGGIGASMEMMSTMHRPYGAMHEEVQAAEAAGRRVFKWCLWEVIEKCEGRSCSQCALAGDCGGRAKEACGYLRIDDAVQQMQRSSRAAWEAEMLCTRPSVADAVFGDFDAGAHLGTVDYDANLPLYRAMDFGYVNPFVCLWMQVDEAGVVRVIDEYVRSRASIDANIAAVKAMTPCREERVAGTFCDPAGAAANDVTGTSAVRELRSHGIEASYRKSGIMEGIELVRRALRDGQGRSRLIVSRRCVRLIEALQCYHYAEGSRGETPEKDGVYDHPVDALRYFFVNYESGGKVIVRRY